MDEKIFRGYLQHTKDSNFKTHNLINLLIKQTYRPDREDQKEAELRVDVGGHEFAHTGREKEEEKETLLQLSSS